ncbi:MAG: TVP38/TMEM64 family protein [Aureliella sp.]
MNESTTRSDMSFSPQENSGEANQSDHAVAVGSGNATGHAKWIVLAVLVGLVGLGYWWFGDLLSLESLAAREQALRDYQTAHPWLVFGVAFAIYVAITGFSLPGAAVLTLVYGWYFGLRDGLVLVSFASTTGATIAFLMSRYFLRDSIQSRFGERLRSFDRSLESEGAFYLFTLRLIPAVPFFVINAVMGLTSIRVWTFWWVSQVGMLAGTFVYVYAGSRVPGLEALAKDGVNSVFTPAQMTQFVIAFSLLGLFPIVVRRLMPLVHSIRKGASAL